VEVDGHLNSLLAVVQKDMTDDTVLFLRLSFSSLALALSLSRSLSAEPNSSIFSYRFRSSQIPIRLSAAATAGEVILRERAQEELIPCLAKLLNDPQADIRLAAVQALKRYAKKFPEAAAGVAFPLGIVVPPLLERAKDRSALPVKIASERALLRFLQGARK
jgi:HEAT repeat protein